MPTTKNTQQNKASTVKKAPTSNQQTKSSTPTKRKCPWCESIVDINSPYCPECGEKLIKTKKSKKKKKHPLLITSLIILGMIIVFGASSSSSSKGSNSNSKQSSSNKSAKSSNSDIPMGQKWVVEGQWELTINSATETTARNQYSEKNPSAVYILDYTYTNLGYYDSVWEEERLYFSLDGLDGSIIDNAGQMGYSYPADVSYYPQETPIGASCHAQVCIGVDNAGDFKVKVSKYDGNGNSQKATMSVSVK